MYGRTYEKQFLQKAIQSPRAELGVIYGRRRIGKSTLLKSLIGKEDFYFEGIKGLSKSNQIRHFARQLARQINTIPVAATSWQDVFDTFTPIIAQGRHYIVFDELPWMASEKTELIAILKFYWDQKWKNNPKITLVLCGSIAQFMVKHVIHSEALHNRKTFELKLEPLAAHESKNFFNRKRSNIEIAQFLMVFGGIPKYLEQINPNESLSVNLDRLCFMKSGFFLTEFETIFKEQFKVSQKYGAIVKALSRGALTKEDLSTRIKIKAGGGLTSYLENLERADFIKKYSSLSPFEGEKSKTVRYVLWDEWLRFYFRFVAPHIKIIERQTSPGLFRRLTSKPIANYWGLSFEQFCIKNIDRIFSALTIDPAEVINFGPYFRQPSRSQSDKNTEGLQIDLLIQRQDNVLTLIECKFTDDPIGTPIIKEIERKVKILKLPARISIEKVLIAPSGITSDLEETNYFNKVIGIDDFF